MLIAIFLILLFLIEYKITNLKFTSFSDFIQSGVKEIASHFQFGFLQQLENGRKKNHTTPTILDEVAMVGKFVAITTHILFIAFNYTLAILLEILVFFTCLAVFQIGHDFWDTLFKIKSTSDFKSLNQVDKNHFLVFFLSKKI